MLDYKEGLMAGEQILEVLHRYGWATAARRSYITDIEFARERIARMMAGRPRPSAPPPASASEDPSGVILFARE